MSKSHCMTKTRTYRIYRNMRNRCRNPKFTSYPWYGAQGIDFCPEWETFEGFYADMGVCPSDEHSLERKRGLEGYSKNNCIWATTVEQANNKLSNTVLTLLGRTQTLMQWSRELGLTPARIRLRLRRGASDEFALSLDVHPMLRRTGTKQKIKTSDWRKSSC